MNVRRLLTISFILFYMAAPANAATGVLDTEDEFPYVVQIDIETDTGSANCTGVVTTDNLVTTAAHCVWDEKHRKLANSVRIHYRDIHGINREANSRLISIPSTYDSAVQNEDAYVLNNRLTDGQKYWAANMQRAMQDIAFIVPDRIIEVEGYAHWITELLSEPFSDYLKQMDCGQFTKCTNRPTQKQEDYLLSVIKRELGDLTHVNAKVVGYGGFDCLRYVIDDQGNDDCKRDDKKRIGEAPLVPSITFGGTQYGVPWVWCSGKNAQGLNPVRRGDSGGPMFVRAVDGKWYFTGYLAIGGDWGCSSSLMYNLSSWKSVLDSKEYLSMPQDRERDWYIHQTARAFREAMSAFSLPNNEALARLRSLYGVYNGDGSSEGWQINGKVLTFPEIYRQKKELFERWPKRQYVVVEDTLAIRRITLYPGHQSDDAFYQVKVRVNWQFENPATNEKKSGFSQYKLRFNMVGIEASQLIGHGRGPVIHEEIEGVGGLSERKIMLHTGIDFRGDDLYSWKNDTLADCIEECRDYDGCAAFTFNRTKNVCFIKGGSGRPAQFTDAISGTADEDSLTAKIVLKPSTDYNGGDFTNSRNISLDDCKRLCSDDGRCRAFSYVNSKQWCFLKSSVGEAHRDDRMTGGVKN